MRKEETESNLAAIGNAIVALEKGLSGACDRPSSHVWVAMAASSIWAGSFLQTNDADDLRQVLASANLRHGL